MTIAEVAGILNRCAAGICDGCRYIGEENCKDSKVKEMGHEIWQIVDEMEKTDGILQL